MIAFKDERRHFSRQDLSETEAGLAARRPRILRMTLTICLTLAALMIGTHAMAILPAFPGAEGGGALAVGGRGGAVCKVTNLNDSGPGSLRDCVQREGPRTVIFEVGGTIKLRSMLTIENPYITIAGQTAPGGGIQIKAEKDEDGKAAGWRPSIVVLTHDVIIRYLRLRRGYVDSKEDNISVGSGGKDVIFDHLSIFWGENQNVAVRNFPGGNITFQNNIIAEPVDGRVAALINADTGIRENVTDVDFINNLWTTSSHRVPRYRVARGRFINNIIYNWNSWASRAEGGVHVDWIGNLWKPGPETLGSRVSPELMFTMDRGIADRLPELYVEGNRGVLSGMSPNTDNWTYTREFGPGENDEAKGPTPLEWRRLEPLPPQLFDGTAIPRVTVRHVDELEDFLLPIVGASRRLDCEGNWVPNRDAADERVITEYLNNRGMSTSRGRGEEIYGGHPEIASGAPCQDSSGDGIPDKWAIANGLDPQDGEVGNMVHESGLTYLELYLNGLSLGPAPPDRVERITVE